MEKVNEIPQIKPGLTVTPEEIPEEQAQVQQKPETPEPREKALPEEESILVPKDLTPISKETDVKPEVIEPKPSKFKAPKLSFGEGKTKKILLGIAVAALVLILAVLIPSFLIFQKSKALAEAGTKLIEVSKGQNIDAIRAELGNTKESLEGLQKSFGLISWLRILPFFGAYVSDADHALKAGDAGLEAAEITLTAVEPYADILGFSGGQVEGVASDGAKTAQERIEFLVAALPDFVPKAEEISRKATIVRDELSNIDPNRYPVKFRGREVREKLKRGLDMVNQGAEVVIGIKPLLESAPYLLGLDEQRTYLVLFQNDKELRPTGGFMTAYSIMNVDKAKFDPILSSDIYDLDAKYKPSVVAPEPIVDYLKGPYTLSNKLRLRDMNWSPDFAESMELFTKEAEKAGVKDIDGVIAVDTHLLVNLLDAIGEIGVSGFGNFSTKIVPECNCPQVIFELESFADTEGPIVWSENEPGKIVFAPPNYDDRKKIIGPLMNSLLANAMGQPKEKLPKLFEAVLTSLLEKHVLFYMYEPQAQAGVEAFGIAGKLKDYPGDYLYINDANLGGRKSNLYVTQEVESDIDVAKDGSVEKTLTITYKNPEKHDGWLNSVLPNWVRVYVPEGSELISAEGFEDKADPYSEFGKTVYAGYFQLRPEGVSKITLKYKLPFKVKGDYKVYIQKQPGKDAPLYILRAGKKEEELLLNTDKEVRLKL